MAWLQASRARVVRARDGFALLIALLLMAVMTLLLVAGMRFSHSSLSSTARNKWDSEAYDTARAGLVDAVNWFKRQPVQPVTDFVPLYNAASPQFGDTDDPDLIDPGQASGTPQSGDKPTKTVKNVDKPYLGIVRETLLDPVNNIWARYEVGKVTKLEADKAGHLTQWSIYDQKQGWLPYSMLSKATSDVWEGVQDVTANYGLGPAGSGLVWRIRCQGYIVRRDPSAPASTPYFQPPNQVLAQADMVAEIRRLQLKDYYTALHTLTGGDLTFNNGTNIKIKANNGIGVTWDTGPTFPNPTPLPATITGSSGQYNATANDTLSWSEVFGVPDGATLASMSDLVETDVSSLPTKMPGMALIYLKPSTGTATFNQIRPLNGGGILVVDGNLNIADYSGSLYAGYIYVNGNYYQGASSSIDGEVVVTGTSTMASPSDIADLEYDGGLLSDIRTQLGQYREHGTPQRVIVGTTP